ncbi:hypothetical protein P691DRAFT_408499 [Macrolepiota fuliginosa MF-IS2]|uniref:Uncharacterized protein n=1 Tax=Macrolepiota fuliginosa MF-IS2 TaxID=1400762 RepID=A0A9P5X335_9AGAR|nr:hypothetical protein P691DRAFT_408499 [Macrolepiota fuliginosa MF-IS2]
MSTHALANFLGLDKGTFYAAIRRLHSVLDVPAAGGAHSCPIQFYHASFREFLKNPSRSGVFVLTEGEVFRDFVIPCIQWCNYRVGSNCRLNDRCCIEAPGLSWTLQDRREELYEEIGRFAKTACWRVCYRISKGDVTKVVDELHKFQFCHLRYVGEDFVQFVNWLHSLVSILELSCQC